MGSRRGDDRGVIASPNIWHWPAVYEVENRAQDTRGAVYAALREAVDWAGRDVVDVGCGTGFHLPMFAADARSVVGVEPHPPLRAAARRRVAGVGSVTVVDGSAAALPLPDSSVDLVHARTAYFFGPGCGAGITEAMRVLRPGGALAVVDLDATAHPYGKWMRADLPHYRPDVVEAFFETQGFDLRRIDTEWSFPDRDALGQVLRIEFGPEIAARAWRETPGTALTVRYRLHIRRRSAGLVVPDRTRRAVSGRRSGTAG
ncbi:MAG: class I SAM-dependent methyltransferase [Rhodococcus sp.]|uniref:class I SAM-dependent methyltransferase n=1 Tax=Rhodococcus sp. TaxID=1831 RepID=UPI0016B0D0EF|nr:class I SAM-dependent methyltransferase [Rhodococcus sp. (in: high G+C Gram-positive bacteria)]NLV79463.1 class I SAM-dependent methyltransferase [Rhodococcus sp. (in: high G+C Gram-positive bacteria)]